METEIKMSITYMPAKPASVKRSRRSNWVVILILSMCFIFELLISELLSEWFALGSVAFMVVWLLIISRTELIGKKTLLSQIEFDLITKEIAIKWVDQTEKATEVRLPISSITIEEAVPSTWSNIPSYALHFYSNNKKLLQQERDEFWSKDTLQTIYYAYKNMKYLSARMD